MHNFTVLGGGFCYPAYFGFLDQQEYLSPNTERERESGREWEREWERDYTVICT